MALLVGRFEYKPFSKIHKEYSPKDPSYSSHFFIGLPHLPLVFLTYWSSSLVLIFRCTEPPTFFSNSSFSPLPPLLSL